MKTNKIKNIIWGVVLLLIAVALVLYKLEIPGINILPEISLWKVLLGVACACWLIDSITTVSYGGITFSLAFLGIIFGKELHIEALVPWTLLIVAFLAYMALHLLFPRHCRWNHQQSNCGNREGCYAGGAGHPNHVETVEGDSIVEDINFTGATKYIHSDNFIQADIHCSFCGAELYFDKVQVPSGEATIYLDTKYCGVEMYVPRNWMIVNEMNTFLAGLDIDERTTGEPIVKIHLCGNSRFSGVEIRRV